MEPKVIGIYKITSPSKKIYIGQSIEIYKRWEKYKRWPESIKSQIKLYNSLKKYGWEQHVFEIIEECIESLLLERETHWKNFYKVLEVPSLCCRIDGKGGKNSKETNIKIGLIHKGLKYSQESKDKISKAKKGIIFSEEHKLKISKAHKGRKYSSDTILKMSKSHKGKIRTEEFKQNLSQKMKEAWKNNNKLKNR